MTSSNGAVVVGAGIVGLASAFRLAFHGEHVTLLDPAPGAGATHAAAGMIAPSAEITPGERENYHLQRGALAAWRTLVEQLKSVTGDAVAIYEPGTLVVGYDASDRRLVQQFHDVAVSFGATGSWVARADRPDLFAGLSSRINDGLLLPGDAWLDPDEAVRVLLDALERLEVRPVTATVTEVGDTTSGVVARADGTAFHARRGIVATGAAALPTGLKSRSSRVVRPVRGMTVRLEGLDAGLPMMVRAHVHGRALYLVHRPGGYGVLGATSEEKRELGVEVGDLQRLLRDALDVVPSLESARHLETRQGLRPATGDLAPFFEVLGANWAWSSGHYRHGVTLAPLAAHEALDFVREVS